MNKQVEQIRQQIERLNKMYEECNSPLRTVTQAMLNYIGSLPEEKVSDNLQQAANDYAGHAPEVGESIGTFVKREAFIAGAQWKKEQMIDKICKWVVKQTED